MSLRNNLWPVTASLLLHGAIIGFVMIGWESSSAPKPSVTPRYIEAKLVEMQPKAQAAAQPEKVQKVDLTKQREEQARKREQERLEQQRREQQRKEQQRKEQERKEKERQEQQKREAERKRLEEQRRQQEEQQRLERQRQQQAEELRKALEAEEGMIMEQAYQSQAQSYMDAIARRIEQNWSRPSSARNNMQALLSIQLVPTGRVVSVNVVKSSGNAAFDRSAEQAVRQVEVFPEVKDMPPEVFERYYRRFNLLFNPQDLRQ